MIGRFKKQRMASLTRQNNKLFIVNISNLRADFFSLNEAGETSDFCVTYR